jgi:hypothetical protein
MPVVARGTRKTELPSNIVLKAGERGLTEESPALGEQVRSISTARFTKQLPRRNRDWHRTKDRPRLVAFAFWHSCFANARPRRSLRRRRNFENLFLDGRSNFLCQRVAVI